MSTSKQILFFGTEDFSAAFLEMLIAEHYDVRAVITKPDSKKGRGQKLTAPLVKKVALKHEIAVWQPEKLSSIAADIQALGDVAGVLVSYGKIVPQSIIELFNPGIINVHPSLLPKYRGPSPVESAILHGDSQTGVSIMQLAKAMDAGPVYSQMNLPLTGTETQSSLYSQLQADGLTELQRVLPNILDGSLQPIAQNKVNASYCLLIKKTNAVIDWSEPAEIIERKIRAFRTWPQMRTTINSIDLIITAASVSNRTLPICEIATTSTALLIGTTTNALSPEIVKVPGKKEMPIQAFLTGYISKL